MVISILIYALLCVVIIGLLYLVKREYWDQRHTRRYGVRSMSQEGEDMVLRRFIGNRKTGFYVDVGAHHPERFSTTKYYYDLGWRGINIDATPGSMQLFNCRRPEDRNIEQAIGSDESTLQFFMFHEGALNTFDAALAQERSLKYGAPRIQEVRTKTLASILDREMPSGQTIDFLNIDVEGLDLAILRSNDWSKYRPVYVLVESLLTDTVLDAIKTDTYSFLLQNNYGLAAKTANTMIFRDNAWSPPSFVGR